MKKYMKIAQGAVGTSMMLGMGSAVTSKLGGSTAGIDAMAGFMPAAIGLGMGQAMIGSMNRKTKRRSRNRR